MIDLRNVDCMQLLRTIPDNSIDLVIVDPPYYKIVNEQWDNQWPTEKEYLDWCSRWTNECFRVLKPNRCFYVWGTTKTDTFLRYKLDVLNNIDQAYYQSWIIWHYEYGGKPRHKFARKHEDLLMYSKGEDFLFNAEDVRIPYINKNNSQNKPGGKIPTDVWYGNKKMRGEDKVIHPTQKPIKILKRIIAASSNRGDIILDCFSGSGSTMYASKVTDRCFIGCEIDKEYYDDSMNRVASIGEV